MAKGTDDRNPSLTECYMNLVNNKGGNRVSGKRGHEDQGDHSGGQLIVFAKLLGVSLSVVMDGL